MVSTASTNALPMNCPWRNKLSPSPRPRRGVHIVKVCPVDNIYLLCYTATCLSSIAGAGYSSPFPSHQGVHTRWFGRALEWHSRGQRFDPAYLHQQQTVRPTPYGLVLSTVQIHLPHTIKSLMQKHPFSTENGCFLRFQRKIQGGSPERRTDDQ